MRTFWHMDILAQAPKCLPKRPCCLARCQNIHVPKCSGAEIFHAEMSLVPKIPRAKKCPCRNVHLRSALQTFPGRCQNVPGMKNPCKNVSCQNLRFRNGGKPLSVLRSSVHRFKNLLMGRLLVFRLKESLLECATVCVKSEVMLISMYVSD